MEMARLVAREKIGPRLQRQGEFARLAWLQFFDLAEARHPVFEEDVFLGVVGQCRGVLAGRQDKHFVDERL